MGKLDGKLMSLAKVLIPGIAGLAQLWTGEPSPGWATVQKYATTPYYKKYLGHALVASFTGVRLAHMGQRTTEFDVMGTLNPVDFRNAPVPKVMLVTRLALEGIEAVGQFVSGIFRDILK